MGIRKAAAMMASSLSTGVLRHVFHRPAANLPGKVALYLDPAIIGEAAATLSRGSIVVVGTNGKTTTTNLLADALEASGQRVVCNRTGANLSSGIATALLQAGASDWGVFECDELWLAKVLPHLQSDYVVLLNLFRDQLDRMGEIDTVQASIVEALKSSPATVLIYNADDPHCTAIADAAPNKTIPFGLAESLGLERPGTVDTQMCQQCGAVLDYSLRQYGQLGDYHCTSCGFKRHSLDFAACDMQVGASELQFRVQAGQASDIVRAPVGGAYMVYNLLACYVAAVQLGVPAETLKQTVAAFDPDNGRLQQVDVNGRKVLLNLAKNPVGFDQNIQLVAKSEGKPAVAFFVNDAEGDGFDVSWLWDVDFELLAKIPDLVCFVGGIRKNDLQLRLKYAGVHAELVEGGADVVASCQALPADYEIFLIANYTALPGVREDVLALAAGTGDRTGTARTAIESQPEHLDEPVTPLSPELAELARPLRIVHLMPELLNLHGDGGNVKVLEQRCLWRGIPVEVLPAPYGEAVDFSTADIVFLSGGPGREQARATDQLLEMREDLAAYVEGDGVLLAICGGFQLLGQEWLFGDELRQGLGILPLTTKPSATRFVGNVLETSPLATRPVIGFENHSGNTYLGMGVQAFAQVKNAEGRGNNDTDKQDGIRHRNVVASYLHGPLLGKNPELADHLIRVALERRLGHAIELPALRDVEESAANDYMAARLG